MDEGVDAAIPLRIYGNEIDRRRIVIAFNAPHDIKLARAELRYAGFPDRYMQTRYICAMQGCRQVVDARTADGRKKAPKLGEACAHFDIPYSEDQHVAIDDAERALEIIRRLRDMGQMPAFKDPYDKPPKRK
jgi:DNA polymerase III epsilon subunit-like protein